MKTQGDAWIILLTTALLLWLAAGAEGQTAEAPRPGAEPAQATVPRQGVTVGVGMGTGSRDIAGHLSLWIQKDHHAIAIRSAGASDFNILSPSDSESDLAVLYGRRGRSARTWGRIGVGPGVVQTVRSGPGYDCSWFVCSYDRVRETTVGLAFQADGTLAFSRFLGLGISIFGNLNSAGSFGGAALTIHLGAVR